MDALRDALLLLVLSYLGATFSLSGAAHLARFARFRGHLRAHGIVPRPLQTLTAAAVTLLEIGAGMVAITLLRIGEPLAQAMLFTFGAITGTMFLFYLRRLLWRRGMRGSCGCSPLEGPLTPVSLVPAGAVIAASLLGLVATFAGGNAAAAQDPALVLMAGWGVTLAALVVLLPGTMPPLQATAS